MKKYLNYFLTFCFTFSFLCNVVHASQLNSTEILQKIENEGAKDVIKELRRKYLWEYCLQLVETGDKEWLKVAEALQKESDGAATLGLRYAISRALIHSPEIVLRMVNNYPGFYLFELCTIPYNEANPATVKEFVTKAEKQLMSVESQDLQSVKQECLVKIKELYELYKEKEEPKWQVVKP